METRCLTFDRHTYPETVQSEDWWQYEPYMGAVSGEIVTVGSGRIRYGVCLAHVLKVGDVIPTGIVLNSGPQPTKAAYERLFA